MITNNIQPGRVVQVNRPGTNLFEFVSICSIDDLIPFHPFEISFNTPANLKAREISLAGEFEEFFFFYISTKLKKLMEHGINKIMDSIPVAIIARKVPNNPVVTDGKILFSTH